MKQNLVFILIIGLIVMGGAFSYSRLYNFIRQRPANPPENQPAYNNTQSTSLPIQLPTLSTALEQETAKVLKEGGTIPFDYTVISVGNDSAEVSGLKGNATLPKSELVTFFFKEGETNTPAGFADLKVGQKLTISRDAATKKLTVYIVSK